MAIADQTTVAAKVRRFADLLADEPAVERIWYQAEPPHAPWSTAYVSIWVQIADSTDAVNRRVTDALLTVWPHEDPNEDLPGHAVELSVATFVLDWLPDRNLEEEFDPEAVVEIPLRGRR
jgi:hypothetical protein